MATITQEQYDNIWKAINTLDEVSVKHMKKMSKNIDTINEFHIWLHNRIDKLEKEIKRLKRKK